MTRRTPKYKTKQRCDCLDCGWPAAEFMGLERARQARERGEPCPACGRPLDGSATRPKTSPDALPCHCGSARHRGETNRGEAWICDECTCIYRSATADFPIEYGLADSCAELRDRERQVDRALCILDEAAKPASTPASTTVSPCNSVARGSTEQLPVRVVGEPPRCNVCALPMRAARWTGSEGWFWACAERACGKGSAMLGFVEKKELAWVGEGGIGIGQPVCLDCGMPLVPLVHCVAREGITGYEPAGERCVNPDCEAGRAERLYLGRVGGTLRQADVSADGAVVCTCDAHGQGARFVCEQCARVCCSECMGPRDGSAPVCDDCWCREHRPRHQLERHTGESPEPTWKKRAESRCENCDRASVCDFRTVGLYCQMATIEPSGAMGDSGGFDEPFLPPDPRALEALSKPLPPPICDVCGAPLELSEYPGPAGVERRQRCFNTECERGSWNAHARDASELRLVSPLEPPPAPPTCAGCKAPLAPLVRSVAKDGATGYEPAGARCVNPDCKLGQADGWVQRSKGYQLACDVREAPTCVRCGVPLEQARPARGVAAMTHPAQWVCFNACCNIGAQIVALEEAGALVRVARVEPTTPVAPGPSPAAGASVPAAQVSSPRQHFSGIGPEEGEKIEMSEQHSLNELGDSSVAKVGLETTPDTERPPPKKPRGRPRKNGGAQSLQTAPCRDGGNGTSGRGSVGPSGARAELPPVFELAMGCVAAVSHVTAALDQLDSNLMQAGQAVPFPLRIWVARVLYHLTKASEWLAAVKRFSSVVPVGVGDDPITVNVLLGGEKYPVRLVALCGRYLCVRVEVTESFFPAPRWSGWFDGKSGLWLADGMHPDAWSDRLTLDLTSLPTEIRAEVEKQ